MADFSNVLPQSANIGCSIMVLEIGQYNSSIGTEIESLIKENEDGEGGRSGLLAST